MRDILKEIELRANEFWQRTSWEDLAKQQGVCPVERLEDLAGGWPVDQINDGFEEALERWRRTSSWDENETSPESPPGS